MSVKGNQIKIDKAPGIDQRYKDTSGTADDIRNARICPTGLGWLFDRGIQGWKDFSDGFAIESTEADAYLNTKHDSIYVWTKQNAGQVYHLFEQNGTLYYLWGNNNGGTGTTYFRDRTIISENRRIPKVTDSGTQYIPFGNRLLIINGYDKPIWFYGDKKSRDFGFSLPTPQIELINIQPDYQDGTTALRGGTAEPAFTTSVIGLGDRTAGDVSVFNYKMTFITDSGSESPLGATSSVNWTVESAYLKRFGVFMNELPTGPTGTVSRRIYRTKNQRLSYVADSREELYYLVKEIRDNTTTEFIDVIPDSALVNLAPALTDSMLTSSTYQYGEAWNGRMWLAGGDSHPTRIIYSQRGLPEQFGTFNYFELGNTNGGHITQIFSYYNNLIVFRESSIDIVREGSTGLTVSQLAPNIGTVASNTISLVPEVGVVFLSKDGMYSISGGLDGGSQIQIAKLSNGLGKEIQNISISALPRATAAYSVKEKEYWCHYVRKGETVPTRGIVLHQQTKQWSLRGAFDKADEYLWKFTCIATDTSGNFLLGTSPTWKVGAFGSSPTVVAAKGYLAGVQVWSGSNKWGDVLTVASSVEGIITYTAVDGALQENVWQSNWIDFGDGSIKHRAFNVELEMIAFGDNEVTLEWGMDYDSTWNSAGSQKISKPEVIFTIKEDAVFGPADATVTKSPFKVGTSPLKGIRVVNIRFDVNTQLTDNFRFRIRREGSPFHLLGYKINFNNRDQLALNQKAKA